MKLSSHPCIVFSDYPIKTMAYRRFLSDLGETAVHAMHSLTENLTGLKNAKLVIVDMNISKEIEDSALALVETSFPNAYILLMEESHRDMTLKLCEQRDICRLGKLAETKVIHSTLKEMLIQAARRVQNKSRLKYPDLSGNVIQTNRDTASYSTSEILTQSTK